MFGLITFANGALGQWTDHYAGHGLPFGHRMVFGTRGSIAAPGDRNGKPVRLTLDDGTDICDERVLEYAPSYRLSPVAADLFGDERPWTYDLDFPVIDRKLLALEYHELASCVRSGAAARSRWRVPPCAPSPWSTPCSNRRSPAAPSPSPRSNRAPSTPTSAKSTTTSA